MSNGSPELVHALLRSVTCFVGMYIEGEGGRISMAVTSRVLIDILSRPESGIFSRQALKCCIDRLLFGCGKANCCSSLLQGENLGSQHRCIGNTDQAISMLLDV